MLKMKKIIGLKNKMELIEAFFVMYNIKALI
jgi:hypothetical protein